MLAFVISCLASQASSQSNSWPRSVDLPNDGEAIASHFVGFVQGYAASRGYRVSEISQKELFERLNDRANDLMNNKEAQLDAEAGLMKLVDTMIRLSNDPPGQRLDPSSFTILGERSFFPALSSLCPLWPICS